MAFESCSYQTALLCKAMRGGSLEMSAVQQGAEICSLRALTLLLVPYKYFR